MGVGYMIWLGARMFRNAKPGPAYAHKGRSPASLKALWFQGFLTSAANPKAVVFFAALFPQFILAESPFWPQFLILSATYIVVDGLFLSAYGIGADRIASNFTGARKAWIERAGGCFMILAANSARPQNDR